jgi:DNA/RNA endonuclease YhcR with UshA esterase domain
LTANIYEAKRLTPNAWVKVKGRVTAPPGLFGARTMYIQDGAAGIMVYLPKDHRLELQVGEKVEVEGNLKDFHGEWEISVSSRGDVKRKGVGEAPPPLPIATTSLLEPYEGLLVMLRGRAVRFKGRTTIWVDDGTGPAKVYLRSKTGIKKPFIEPGTPVTVVGVVSQYTDKKNPSRYDYRLLPRFQTDLLLPKSEPPPVPSNWPTMLPETGY